MNKQLISSIPTNRKFFFVGVSGIGMSCIAIILSKMGYKVAGSCNAKNNVSNIIESFGITVHYTHDASNVQGFDYIAVSTAIPESNPEVKYAKENNIKVLHRSEVLNFLMNEFYSIGIAGCHGKTTVSSYLTSCLHSVRFPINSAVGGIIHKFGWNGTFDENAKHIVAEVDESDRSLVNINYDIAVVTNIDNDHMENYNDDFNYVIETFKSFLSNNHKGNPLLVLCADDKIIQERIIPSLNLSIVKQGKSNGRIVSFGIKQNADFMAKNIRHNALGMDFDLIANGNSVGEVSIPLYGEYNVLNALAIVSVMQNLGIDIKSCIKSLSDFKGVDRRFSMIYKTKDNVVIDDYSHHPTEIEVFLKAVQNFIKDRNYKRLICIFEPHRYSRVTRLLSEYIKTFKGNLNQERGDCVFIMPVYGAGDVQVNADASIVNNQTIADEFNNSNCLAKVVGSKPQDMESVIKQYGRKGDVWACIGAGSVSSNIREVNLSTCFNNANNQN